MSETETTSPGLPVEIDEIDKALANLWEQSGDSKTRASLINLAIYSENPKALGTNTDLISEIARNHACRALLIQANPELAESRALAWISAHCHIYGSGDRQVCSEQITFQLDGEAVQALPNVVFSHLDSDLPLCFWWQGELNHEIDERLMSWIDRLVYDSREWRHPGEQFEIARRIRNIGSGRVSLGDLNWARILSLRTALAQIGDHPVLAQEFATIKSIDVCCSPSGSTTGILLLGWLAAQLGWTAQPMLGNAHFVRPDGSHIEYRVSEKEGPSISHVLMETGKGTIEIFRQYDSKVFHIKGETPETRTIDLRLPTGNENQVDLLLLELSRGRKHALYIKALEKVLPLLQE